MTRYQVALRAVPVALVLAAASPASAQEGGEPTDMAKFLGYIGIIELPKEPPNYRERAPLVVPPSVSLVPPQDPDSIQKINPDFPIDHDELVRRSKKTDPKAQAAADDIFYNNRKLPIDQMVKKKPKDQNAGTATGEDASFHDPNQAKLSPSQLGFKGWGSKEEDKRVVFKSEPERGSLTEPPAGYRTPSPNAPYGIVTQSQKDNKAPGFFDKGVDADTATRR